MKHTKNILKSLLITVMALSLLAVSCKKDEGGSKPTDPTTTTITATMLTEQLKSIGKLSNDSGDIIIDFSNVDPQSGKAAISGATKKFTDLKNALDSLLTTGMTSVTLEGKYSSETTPQSNTDLVLTVTITAKSGYVLDAKMADTNEYTYDKAKKTATIEISINPSGNWE